MAEFAFSRETPFEHGVNPKRTMRRNMRRPRRLNVRVGVAREFHPPPFRTHPGSHVIVVRHKRHHLEALGINAFKPRRRRFRGARGHCAEQTKR
jgi:hypothetical protein